jgi:hypothetical protein
MTRMTGPRAPRRPAPKDAGYCDHDRAGIVTNQPDGYDPNRNHAAASVCANPTCRARAMAWVQQTTGEPGVYLSDTRPGGPREPNRKLA